MSRGIRITTPYSIGPAQLVATDVPENDYAAWSSGSTFTAGQRCIKDHFVWESVAAGNINHDPAVAANVGTWWLKVSATNCWRAFDDSYTTLTTKTGGFYYELTLARYVSAVHILAIKNAKTVRVRLTDPSVGEVYDSGLVQVGRGLAAASWWQWCFGRRAERDTVSLYDLPLYPSAVLRIDVAGDPAQECSVGTILAGALTELGEGVEYGLRIGIDDYSKKARNQWGDVSLQVGNYSKRIDLTLWIDNDRFDSVFNFLAARRAQVLFWSISDRWQTTQLWGFYKSCDMVIPYYSNSTVALSIEGMSLT